MRNWILGIVSILKKIQKSGIWQSRRPEPILCRNHAARLEIYIKTLTDKEPPSPQEGVLPFS